MEPRSLRPHSTSFASLPLLLLLCSVFALSVAQHTPRCGDDDRETPAPNDNGEYDFIVVGGGTGGAIVASRLSKYFNVLLLEAGDRLYDSAELSFKYLSPVLLGSLDPSNGLSSVLDPILKGIGKITPEGFFLDSEGHLHGSVGEGVPGFMPHIQETPFMAFYMTMSEAAHYYPTVPQIYSQKREIDYPRGNCLGGSSAANTMVYFRGSKRDFEQWKDEFGLEGWGYEDVLPYFKKYENNVDIQDDRVHGHHGPINITIVKNHFPSPATDAWTETALKLGYPKITDASNPETTYGASDSWQQFVGPNGKRSDTSDYIRILDSKGKVCWNKPKEECEPSQKLHIWTKKYVTKVLIDTSSTEAGGRPRAYGVEYVDDASSKEADRTYHPRWRMRDNEGKKHHKPFNKWDKDDVQSKIPTYGAPVDRDLAFDYDRTREQYIPYYDEEIERQIERKRVTARHEVILSSGAVVTGQLLMLSGIGPANHLKERGISVIADLPVGQRMQDHQEVMSLWKFPDAMTPGFNFLSEAAKGFPTLRAHLKGERTFFSSNGVPAGLEGSSAGPHGTVPKWHMHHITMGAFENFDYNLAAYDETVNPPYRIPRSPLELFRWKGLTLHAHNCELSQNHAYGRLELRSKDPFQPPLLDPRYGSSEEDNLEMVDCLETVREIMNNTDPLYAGEELGASAKAKTREQLLQFVRNAVWGHHISGSAPMGSCSVPFAVTDPRARVKKVDGLRVCDISLVPTIPHGNPAGVVMMMAEKIADLIKQDHKDYFDWSSLSSPTGTDSDPLYHDEL